MKKSFTLLAALALACGMTAQAAGPMLSASLSAAEVKPGDSFDLIVNINVAESPNVMQLSVSSDEEIYAKWAEVNSPVSVEGDFWASGYGKTYLAYTTSPSGFVLNNPSNSTVTIRYTVDSEAPEGTYMLRVSNVLLAGSTADGVKTYEPNDARVFLEVNANAGVESVRMDEPTEAPVFDPEGWYNLQGVRMTEPTVPGLYIHGGKKIIVK